MPPPGLLIAPEESSWATIDGKFFPDLPRVLMSEGRFQKDIDLIMGACQMEGYMLVQNVVPHLLQDDLSENDFYELAAGYAKNTYPSLPDLEGPLTSAIINEYQNGTSAEEVRKAIAEFFGDMFLKIPIYKTAEIVKGISLNYSIFTYH